MRAAQLLERGFANNTLTWLRPSLGTVDNLVPIDASPPNLRDEMCGRKRKRPATDEDADTVASNGSASSGETAMTFFTAGLQPPMAKPSELLAAAPAPSEPVIVYTGPKKTGAALIAAVAVDEQKQTRSSAERKSRVAAKKPDAAEAKQAGKETKSEAKPSRIRRQAGRRQAGPRQAGRRRQGRRKACGRNRQARCQAGGKLAAKPAPKAAKPSLRSQASATKAAPPNLPAKPRTKPAKPSLPTKRPPPRRAVNPHLAAGPAF